MRKHGGKPVKLAPLEVGTPDRLVLLPGGYMYLVELKAHHGKLSPRQEAWHSQAAHRGTPVHVLYGKDGVDHFLQEHYARVDEDTRLATILKRCGV